MVYQLTRAFNLAPMSLAIGSESSNPEPSSAICSLRADQGPDFCGSVHRDVLILHLACIYLLAEHNL